MKGICLCGGSGTRLYPITEGVPKSLLPIYDKPMVYFPLSVLMLAEIRDILIITTPESQSEFQRLLGDGSQFGINLQYATQPKPEGIAQAFIIAEDFLEGDAACLILGDNIFHGAGFTDILIDAKLEADGFYSNETGLPNATVFGYYVNDPERYGVAVFDEDNIICDIEEKPKNPKSNWAITGLYFYPNDVVEKAKSLRPSERGELEITALNKEYLKEDRMYLSLFQRGFTWLDTGTFQSLSQAGNYIESVESRSGLQIGCLEEIAYNKDWITKEQLLDRANFYKNNSYGEYLKSIPELTKALE